VALSLDLSGTDTGCGVAPDNELLGCLRQPARAEGVELGFQLKIV